MTKITRSFYKNGKIKFQYYQNGDSVSNIRRWEFYSGKQILPEKMEKMYIVTSEEFSKRVAKNDIVSYDGMIDGFVLLKILGNKSSFNIGIDRVNEAFKNGLLIRCV